MEGRGGVSSSSVQMSSSPWKIPTGWRIPVSPTSIHHPSVHSSIIRPSLILPSLVRPTFHHPSTPPAILRSILPSSFHHPSIIELLTRRHCRLCCCVVAPGRSRRVAPSRFSTSDFVALFDAKKSVFGTIFQYLQPQEEAENGALSCQRAGGDRCHAEVPSQSSSTPASCRYISIL